MGPFSMCCLKFDLSLFSKYHRLKTASESLLLLPIRVGDILMCQHGIWWRPGTEGDRPSPDPMLTNTSRAPWIWDLKYVLPHVMKQEIKRHPDITKNLTTREMWCLEDIICKMQTTRVHPIDMQLCASTGPVLVRCWQHRTSTSPVLAHNGMFMG